MTDRQIRIFLTVAETLNFTAAAEKLYMSQQAVTRQIAALESEVGVRLLTRTTRSVSLTPAGEIFRKDYTAIDQQSRACLAKIQSLGAKSTNVVSLGVFKHLPMSKLVFPMVAYLMQSYPSIYFDLRLLDLPDLRGQLADQLLDLCIIVSTGNDQWHNVKSLSCARRPIEIIYSKHLPIEHPFTVEQLKRFPRLDLPTHTLSSRNVSWSRQIPFQYYQPCADIPALVTRLEAGQGFALLPRLFEGLDAPYLIGHPLQEISAFGEILCLRNAEASRPELEQIMDRCKAFISARHPVLTRF